MVIEAARERGEDAPKPVDYHHEYYDYRGVIMLILFIMVMNMIIICSLYNV